MIIETDRPLFNTDLPGDMPEYKNITHLESAFYFLLNLHLELNILR